MIYFGSLLLSYLKTYLVWTWFVVTYFSSKCLFVIKLIVDVLRTVVGCCCILYFYSHPSVFICFRNFERKMSICQHQRHTCVGQIHCEEYVPVFYFSTSWNHILTKNFFNFNRSHNGSCYLFTRVLILAFSPLYLFIMSKERKVRTQLLRMTWGKASIGRLPVLNSSYNVLV